MHAFTNCSQICEHGVYIALGENVFLPTLTLSPDKKRNIKFTFLLCSPCHVYHHAFFSKSYRVSQPLLLSLRVTLLLSFRSLTSASLSQHSVFKLTGKKTHARYIPCTYFILQLQHFQLDIEVRLVHCRKYWETIDKILELRRKQAIRGEHLRTAGSLRLVFVLYLVVRQTPLAAASNWVITIQ